MHNRIDLIGYVGQYPEERTTNSGHSLTRFSVATSRRWGKGEDRKEETTWHNCVCWGKMSEIAMKVVEKGQLLHVDGRMSIRSWEDDAGNKRQSAEVVVNNLQILKRPADQGNGSSSEPRENYDDDIPF